MPEEIQLELSIAIESKSRQPERDDRQLYGMVNFFVERLTLNSNVGSEDRVWLWESKKRGEFSISALLTSIGHLQPVNNSNLFDDLGERLTDIEANKEISFHRHHSYLYNLDREPGLGKKHKFNRRKFIASGLSGAENYFA